VAAKKARSNKYSGLLSTRSRGAADQRPWRPLIALGVILVALYATMFGVHATHPRLAIDLAGGTSAVFTADMPNGGTPSAADMGQAVGIMQERVNGYGVSEATVTQEGSNTIDAEIPGQYSQSTVNAIGATAHLYFRPVLTEAAAGSTTTTATPSASASGTSTAKATGTASAAASSTAKASASAAASSSASASEKATGQSESETAKADAASSSASADAPTSATASKSASASASASATGAAASASASASAQANAAYAAYQKLNCSNKDYTGTVNKVPATDYLATCDSSGNKYLLAPSVIDGKNVSNATATPVEANGVPTGQWEIDLTFNSVGSKEFATETSTLYSEEQSSEGSGAFAIALDGVVESAPVVQGAITTGSATITGSFTEAQANQLATTLNYGSLPLNFGQSQVSIVSPTLGGSELQGGLIAGAIGLALVFLYVIVYYRGLSLAAISSLVVAASLTYALACLFGPLIGFTLSLEGVAGLIVAIGITADSFVVFFERLRDELREGRSLRSAIRQGWLRARRTIVASDMVTLIAAVVLYELTVGSVQGFAFTLGLSTVIDLVVVFMFTMPVVTLFSRTNFFGNGHPWSGLDPESLGAPRRAAGAGPRAGARGRMTIAERRRLEAEEAAANDESSDESVEA